MRRRAFGVGSLAARRGGDHMVIVMFIRNVLCAAALAASVAPIACWEADPDQDTLAELQGVVSGWPLEIKHAMAKWQANRIALGYLMGRYDKGEDYIGTIRCVNKGIPHFSDPVIDVTVTAVIKCLRDTGTATYLECLDLILSDRADEYPDRECSWIGHRTGFAPDEIPDDFRAERLADKDLTWGLVGLPPPPIEIQLMLLGLPGMMGARGALCPQGVRWACAPAFGDVPGTTGAATGGGDR